MDGYFLFYGNLKFPPFYIEIKTDTIMCKVNFLE